MENKNWIRLAIVFGSLLFIALMIRATCFTFVENYEFAYKFDKVTGVTEQLVNKDGTYMRGFIRHRPIVDAIHTIDLRPMQICISANSRVLNCKLVRFDPKGFKLFIDWHGRGDYNRENLKDVLMSYAYDPNYDGSEYSFLKIDKGTGTDNNTNDEENVGKNKNIVKESKSISDTISKK